jgi:hypothetical protein
MSISVPTMVEDKVRGYATSGSGNDRFLGDLLMAFRNVISEINQRLNLSEDIPTTLSGTLDYAAEYEWVVSLGLDKWLLRQGQKFDTSVKGAYTVKDAEDAFEMALASWQMNVVQALDNANEDDVVGLGYKGD